MSFREWGLKYKLLRFASELNRPFTIGEAIDRFRGGYTINTIQAALARLVGYGCLKRLKQGVYQLTEKGRKVLEEG